MADWVLTAGLQNLRSQVNEAFPDRDKKSDGTIGDTAHQATTSGHNRDDTAGSHPEWDGDPDNIPEVRAWDMDVDLRAAPATAQQLVDHIRHLPGVGSVLRYIIYNRKIYRSNGWAAEVYDGPSPHTEHIHFSGAYSQASDNNTTFDFKLEEIPVALTAGDKSAIIDGVADEVMRRLRNQPGDILSDTERSAIAEEVYHYSRQQLKPAWSDTAVNLLEADITEAVVAGVTVQRFPANIEA